MTILLVTCGLLVAATLACFAPHTAHEKHFDLAAGVVLVSALAIASLQLPVLV